MGLFLKGAHHVSVAFLSDHIVQEPLMNVEIKATVKGAGKHIIDNVIARIK